MGGKFHLLLLLLAIVTASVCDAADQPADNSPDTTASQGILLAKPLLTESEQSDYRARIRAASDASERERIRTAHYQLMKARAAERGYVLPDRRPAAVGEAGSAFGPELVGEDERAAYRATLRSARSLPEQRASEGIGRSQKESPAVVPQQGLIIDNGTNTRSAPVAPGVAVLAPHTPPANAAVLPSTAVALPGIDTLFGPQLMTEEEKGAYRARLRSAKSDGERQAIRAERDQEMRQRAKGKGLVLPP